MMRPSNGNPVKAVYHRYLLQSMQVIAGCALPVLLGMSLKNNISLLYPLIVTVLFSIAACVAYGMVWKWLKMKAPDRITLFHLAAPIVRMVLGTIVVLAWCLYTDDKSSIKAFILLFFGFYLIILIFDCIFFARFEKKQLYDDAGKRNGGDSLS